MTLILTPLEKALNSLNKALQQPFNEYIRDASIQRFEYSFELCWKMLRRQLIEDHGETSIQMLTRKELFRFAADKGYISDPIVWFTYHRARNETSHLYNESKANEVYQITQQFLPEAQALLKRLQSAND